MNVIGKILTTLILLMSLCFLVIAVMVGASHRNWKDAAAEMKDKAVQAENLLQSAKGSTTEQQKQLAAEKFSRTLQLANLESQLKAALEALKDAQARLNDEIGISQSRLAQLDESNKRLKAQDAEVADLREANSKLVDDIAQKFELARVLQSQKFELTNQLNLLTEKQDDLLANLSQANRVLKANGLTQNSLTDSIVPKRDGEVLKVGNDGLFAVSLGTDDGIRVGHKMDVYRQDRYVGQAEIVQTDADVSVARINKAISVTAVRERDNVTSKF